MSFIDVEFITTWISNNPDWALFIVFSIAFIESLAVVGLLMPGWLLLVGVGILIGTGNINFYLASLFCFFGAVIGEYLSFLVGVHYQQNVHQWSIFKRHPDWLSKTEHFFQRFGTASIALGRFVGPIRAFVPLLAGMSSMPALRFQITNVLSAMIWAPVYLMPGVILGASIQLDSTVRWILLSNIILIVITGWLSLSFLRAFYSKKINSYLRKELFTKLFLSLAAFSSTVLFLFFGEYYQQFLELVILFVEIINQK
ncbi:MAG: membrane protein DedA with SNARE-associated domain [Enterobacterales bacterium]